MNMPPLKVFLTDEWIGGAGLGRVAESGMSTVVSSSAGSLLQFASLAVEGAGGVPSAISTMADLGSQFIDVVQGGSATSIAGFAAAAIQLFVGRLQNAIAKGGKQAKANALQAQWDVASYLVLKRQAKAIDIPGGANFVHVQPGWKKDWPDAAVPPVPHSRFLSEGVLKYRRLVLFEKGTPTDVSYKTDCFSLGGGGCDVPPDAQVGLSLLTYPMMVDEWDLPWGGGQLTPFVAALTSPTVLHVQVRRAAIESLERRMREVMRSLFRVKHGPPFAADAVTLWPDGTYTGPSADQRPLTKARDAKIDASYQKTLAAWKASDEKMTLEEWFKKHPWVPPVIPHADAGPFIFDTAEGVERKGLTSDTAFISSMWMNLDNVSQAFRTLLRFWQCRQACLNHFSDLPSDVQTMARKNPDFSDENIAAWGGPRGGKPKPKPKRVPRSEEATEEALEKRRRLWLLGGGALAGGATIGTILFQRVRARR